MQHDSVDWSRACCAGTRRSCAPLLSPIALGVVGQMTYMFVDDFNEQTRHQMLSALMALWTSRRLERQEAHRGRQT